MVQCKMSFVMGRIFLVLILFFVVPCVKGQLPLPEDRLSKEFHKGRRAALRDLLPGNSVAVIFASPERVYANDVNYKYHPNPDLYYFSGYTEPNAVLFVFKEPQLLDGTTRADEVLFVQKKDVLLEKWTGKRLGVDGAREQLGFQHVYTGEELKDLRVDLAKFSKVVFEYPKDLSASTTPGGIYELVKEFDKKTRFTDDKRLQERADFKLFDLLTSQLRQIKTAEELILMRKAIDISCLAHNEAMKAASPSRSELELQGVQEFIHKKMGAQHVGYPSIVGAGNNGCVLHYIDNEVTRVGDNLVLMDVGAEYHGYTADVTRTFPANGKFTPEQEAIYSIVYQAQEEVFKICKAGTSFKMIEQTARAVVTKGLLKLGIIKNEAENVLYYPHGLTHFLGLDVHDKGIMGLLKENMIITIEPGIYIPEGSNCDKKWWGIAVRIEDDVLIGKDGVEILSHLSPRKLEDVEAMIKNKSFIEDLVLPPITGRK